MSFPRTRHADVLQRIMTSFSQFERKLDKLQNDVNSHGQTLTELRGLVNNLSTSTTASPDRRDILRHSAKKTTAIQYDTNPHIEEAQLPGRRNVVHSLPNKLKGNNYPGQKNNNGAGGNIHAYPSSPKTMNVKRSPRPRKAEAPRKATTLRPQKSFDKKRSKKINT